MKYNKDKQKNLKKFATGGKTPAQIMEEARRNQSIERQDQARDAVKTSGIAAYQSSAPVTIQAPRQEVVLKEYAASKPVSFSQAFGEANKAGLKEFIWNGKRYTTDVAGTSQTTKNNTSTANTTAVNNSTTNTPLSEEQIRRNATIRERGTEGLETSNNPYNEWTPPTLVLTGLASNPNEGGVPKSALQSTQSKNPNFMERGLFGWAWDNLRRVDQQNRAAQIENKRIWDEKYAKHQQGGQLPLRNGLEKFFRIEPRYTSVDSTSLTPTESVTDYMDNTLRGPQRVSKIRKPVDYGSGYLTSTRVIRNPWTDKADTTYIAPTGARFGPSRVIEAPYLQSYPDKFGKYFKYQQGGKVESPSDEMYVDFAVRYLSALGVGETEMVDEEGGLREEYAEAVTVALQEIDSPEFWEHYHSNPDEAVGAYVESKQSPEQVEMAKKGAKLKMLKKAKGGKVKKCKCGCGMTMKKEKGGKLTEVCSCGCKN